MDQTIRPGRLQGTIAIPASKSHTIRALIIASLAEGTSRILLPLESDDTRACLGVCRAFGAVVHEKPGEWEVQGTGGRLRAPANVIDVANSGTTLNLALGMAALCPGWSVFTGDEQIRRRPVGPLIDALSSLGANAFATLENGCPPIVIRGVLRGGRVSMACPTSQYLSSLLICSPLAEADTEIEVLELNEKPYVGITMDWLDGQGIRYCHEAMERFHVNGGQSYRAFKRRIPGDFSSATFFLCAAAVTGSRLTVEGLDVDDSQGDKQVLAVLEEMGCKVIVHAGGVTIEGRPMKGKELDLNAIPDALPALAVTACFAEGTTRLVNVPQARLKETDRISVMCSELAKMGARVDELPDGLVVRRADLKGAVVHGHSDHRVAMALAVAGLAASGSTTIQTAESASVTFPGFFELLEKARGD